LVGREQFLAVLLRDGFTPEAAGRLYATVAHYVIGFAVQLRAHAEAASTLDISGADPIRFPAIAKIVASGVLPMTLAEEFTYGLDLMAMAGELGPLIAGNNLARERTDLLALIRRLQDAVSSLANARAPVINAIHGWCIGGGLDLATACDVRLCSAEAKFSVREVRVAIVADLGTLQRLPRIVGQGHARQLALTGEDFDAAKALRIGLVNEVHETPEALFSAALAMARRIAENPPLVVQGTKRILNENDGQTVAEGLRHVALWNSAFLQSNDLTEAFSAFAERRPPKFEGH
jgi:enoyl-CoA hydratase